MKTNLDWEEMSKLGCLKLNIQKILLACKIFQNSSRISFDSVIYIFHHTIYWLFETLHCFVAVFESGTSSAIFSKILPIIFAMNFIFWRKGDDINVTPGEFEIIQIFHNRIGILVKVSVIDRRTVKEIRLLVTTVGCFLRMNLSF